MASNESDGAPLRLEGRTTARTAAAPVIDPGVARREGPRIVVGICSCGPHRARRQAVRQTWLSPCPAKISAFFFAGSGGSQEDEQDVIALDSPDDYKHLPRKVFAFFRWAVESMEFDWLFKCDDDSFVALDRLETLVDDGMQMVGNECLVRRGAPSGGAGYLLRRDFVEALLDHDALPATGAEDLHVGAIARQFGISWAATRKLSMDASRVPSPWNDQISAHWCSPERLRTINTMLRCEPIAEYQVDHTHWKDHLLMYADGAFGRRATSCNGHWSMDQKSGKLELGWHSWGKEVVQGDGIEFGNPKMRMRLIGGQLNVHGDTPDPGQPDHRRDHPLNLVSPPRSDSGCGLALVISLQGSDRTARALQEVGKISADVRLVNGVTVEADSIRWVDIRGFEAYNLVRNFRGAYVPRALGCRLAGLAALKEGIRLTAGESRLGHRQGFLIFQDDVVIPDPLALAAAIDGLPDGTDALWLDTSQVTSWGTKSAVPGLVRVNGARLCTGFWISTAHAKLVVQGLEKADCEWDVFMERLMRSHRYYGRRRPLCYQRRGISTITGTMKW